MAKINALKGRRSLQHSQIVRAHCPQHLRWVVLRINGIAEKLQKATRRVDTVALLVPQELFELIDQQDHGGYRQTTIQTQPGRELSERIRRFRQLHTLSNEFTLAGLAQQLAQAMHRLGQLRVGSAELTRETLQNL